MATIFSDLAAFGKSIDIPAPVYNVGSFSSNMDAGFNRITDNQIDPQYKTLYRDMLRYCNREYGGAWGAYDRTAPIGSMTPGNRTGGSAEIDLEFTTLPGLLPGTWSYKMFLPVFNTVEAQQEIIDNDLTVNNPNLIPGYRKRDIRVSGDQLNSGSGAMQFHFEGDSVINGTPNLNYIDGFYTGGSVDPSEGAFTIGGRPRPWFAALICMDVIQLAAAKAPGWGATPTNQFSVKQRNGSPVYPSEQTIRLLINEASIQEGQDWNSYFLPLFGWK